MFRGRLDGLLGRIVLVILVVAGLLILAYPGYRESHYADAHAARQSGGGRRIPTFVPDSATNISVLTNLDTMQTWGCFQLPNGMAEFQTYLVSQGAVRRPGEPLPKAKKMLGWVTWWPTAVSETGVDHYELPSRPSAGRTMIGLSTPEDRVCFMEGGTPDSGYLLPETPCHDLRGGVIWTESLPRLFSDRSSAWGAAFSPRRPE